jgi:hypothetical protein
VEDTLHRELQSTVVGIDRLGVVGAAGWAKWAGGGEEWFDGFVTENDERSHRPEAAGKCFIAARAADAGDDVLAAQLFQVIGGLAGAVVCVVLITDGTHPGGDLGGGEAVGRGRQGDHRLDDRAHAGLVEIDAADDGFADPCSRRELLEHVIGDEALIDAAQGVGKSLQHAFQSRDHLGELVERAAAVELLRVMSHGLDAKDTFAFAIDLEGQLAAVQLKIVGS